MGGPTPSTRASPRLYGRPEEPRPYELVAMKYQTSGDCRPEEPRPYVCQLVGETYESNETYET